MVFFTIYQCDFLRFLFIFFWYWHTNLVYNWFVSFYFCLRLLDNFCLCQNTEPCWLRKSSESHSLGKESTVVHFHSIINDKNKTRDRKSDREKTLGNTYLPPPPPVFTILYRAFVMVFSDCQESQTVIILQLNHSAMLLFLQMYLSIIFVIRITLFYSAVLQHTCQSCSSTDGQQLSTELILHKTQMPSMPYLIRSVYVCNIFRAFSVINVPSHTKFKTAWWVKDLITHICLIPKVISLELLLDQTRFRNTRKMWRNAHCIISHVTRVVQLIAQRVGNN